MQQDPDEPFRTFSARVQGKAEVCEFKTSFNINCSNCDTPVASKVYYTDKVICDVLLNNIADSDIRGKALSSEDIQVKPISQVIAFIESREIACNANLPSSSFSALSSYRRPNNPVRMVNINIHYLAETRRHLVQTVPRQPNVQIVATPFTCCHESYEDGTKNHTRNANLAGGSQEV